VYLGVVERGRSGAAGSTRWSFRLTEVSFPALFHRLLVRALHRPDAIASRFARCGG
jgi:hypothetical protein